MFVTGRLIERGESAAHAAKCAVEIRIIALEMALRIPQEGCYVIERARAFEAYLNGTVA